MHENALSFRTGDLAWVILALARLNEVAPDQGYLNAAVEMGGWIEMNCRRDGDGMDAGYSGGWGWDWDTETWAELGTSTEHNIDLVAAFETLHQATGDDPWQARADHARAFVEAMWVGGEDYFETGLNPDGTFNSVNVVDVQAWGSLLLQSDPYADALDWAMDHLRVPVESGTEIRFDFNTDLDGIWYEGTAQMATAFHQAGQATNYQNTLAPLRAAQYKGSHADGRGIPAANTMGLSTGFNWRYFNRLGLGPTSWLIFAENGTNPFTFIPGAIPGDIDNSGAVNLVDAVLAMQVTVGSAPDDATIHITADSNNDGRIGLPDGIFILQTIADLREGDFYR